MNRYRCPALIVGVLLALAGCAGSQYEQGRKLLVEENYAGAVELLQEALEKEPDNPQLLLDLAEGLYHQNRLEQAETHANRARELAPDDGEGVLMLGLIHEKRGDREAAIAVYRTYARLSRLSQTRRLIEGRLDQLIREQIREETQKALAREALLEVADIPNNAVAVAPFRNVGVDRSLDPLQKGLAEMMVTDLSKVRALQVVERLRMQEMMQEIGLGMTGAVAPESAPRLGKLLGASRVVNGSFADLAREQLRMDISVAGVKSDEVEASEAQGPLAKLFRLQKELTFGLIEQMGIELTAEERDSIQEIPTENLLAFIAYSRGLDLEDRGQIEGATEAYREAAERDPGFRAAHERIGRMEGRMLAGGDRRAVEREVLRGARRRSPKVSKKTLAEGFGRPPLPPPGFAKPRGTLDRLVKTGMNAGAGFIPAWKTGQKDLRKAFHEQLDQLEKITFRPDEAVVEIAVPLE